MHRWQKNHKPGSPLKLMYPGSEGAATELLWRPNSEPLLGRHHRHALPLWRGLAYVERDVSALPKHHRCPQTQDVQVGAAAHQPLAEETATLVVAAPLPVAYHQLAAAPWQSLLMRAYRAPPCGPSQGRQWNQRLPPVSLLVVSVCPFPEVTASPGQVARDPPHRIYAWVCPFSDHHAARHRGYL